MAIEGKHIGGILLILLAVGIFFAGQNVSVNAWITGTFGAGIGFLLAGPLGALIGAVIGAVAVNLAIKLFVILISVWTAFIGVLMISLSEDRLIWLVGLWIFAILLVVDLILIDPLPIVDELLFGIGTVLFGIKSINPNGDGNKRLGVF